MVAVVVVVVLCGLVSPPPFEPPPIPGADPEGLKRAFTDTLQRGEVLWRTRGPVDPIAAMGWPNSDVRKCWWARRWLQLLEHSLLMVDYARGPARPTDAPEWAKRTQRQWYDRHLEDLRGRVRDHCGGPGDPRWQASAEMDEWVRANAPSKALPALRGASGVGRLWYEGPALGAVRVSLAMGLQRPGLAPLPVSLSDQQAALLGAMLLAGPALTWEGLWLVVPPLTSTTAP